MRAFVVFSLLFAACATPDGTDVPLEQRDFTAYARDVQPILRSCGSLDCHGVGGRPMRVYAQYGLRADPMLRGQPITDAELADNMAAIAGIGVDRVLGKPLREDAGGMHHVGGDLWPDESSPEYECVAAWLDGVAADTACAAALAATPY